MEMDREQERVYGNRDDGKRGNKQRKDRNQETDNPCLSQPSFNSFLLCQV